MHIIHIAAEMAPIAKVGGLGDVVLGLSRALREAGHTVEVILPRYQNLNEQGIEDLHICERQLWSFSGGTWIHNTVWSGWVQGIRVYLIEPHNPTQYFGRPGIYGHHDDIERFTYFSRAALEFLSQAEIHPDILHLHEWPAALVAPLYWELYQPVGYRNPAIIMTLHNLEHQGKCLPEDLDRVGLVGERFLQSNRLQDDLHPEKLNLLKGGINYADAITTVSPTYAAEIQTEIGGHKLVRTIQANAHKLSGILNGLDQFVWDPATDPYLPVNYDANSLEEKRVIKHHLRERLALDQSDAPLVATVARLVPQKGVDLIRRAIFHTLGAGGQFVLLGSSPIPHIAQEFRNLKLHFAENTNLHLELQPHEELTHLIYAAADIFIVPSLFEPCGLTQQIAMKYGAVPLVRATGGLKDTVFDGRNGFTFGPPTTEALDSALEKALATWEENPKEWLKLVKGGMREDLGWRSPSDAYLALYSKAQKATGRLAPPLPAEWPANTPRESKPLRPAQQRQPSPPRADRSRVKKSR